MLRVAYFPGHVAIALPPAPPRAAHGSPLSSRTVQTFTESDLLFTFPADWKVRKFDETAAYQSLSGRGLKGVDFIAISPDDKLWLIEVKNYRPRKKGGREYRANRKPPDLLARQIARKWADSQRLIGIVHAHLRRSWWRRARLWYQVNVGRNPASNYLFWHLTHRLASSGSAPELVLWMETPERNDDYDVRVYRELTTTLPGANVIVAEQSAPQSLPFAAQPLPHPA